MEFTSAAFFLFCLAFFCGWVVLRALRVPIVVANGYIAWSSALAYALWYPPAVLLLVFLSVIAWLAGKPVLGQLRSAWVFVPALTISLLPLLLFKYWNFVLASLAPGSGLNHGLILPVGISFYTFTLIGYLIDLQRGDSEPARRFTDCFVLIAFWPHLAAGPILRARNVLSNLRVRWVPSREQLTLGLMMVAAGVAKKLLIADNLGAYVNAVDGAAIATRSALEIWTVLLAFSGQIYADFSAYSEMAIGFATLLGFRLPANFNYPYRAASIGEFWRRWHISLSTWFRDYVFVPLGGSRGTLGRTCANLMLVFLISGLWHGAAWNFVVWGGIHGLALCLERVAGARYLRVPRAVRWCLTLLVVLVAWAYFRFPVETANGMLLALLDPARYVQPGQGLAALLPVAGFCALVLIDHLVRYYRVDAEGFPAPAAKRALFGLSLAYVVLFFVGSLLFSGAPLPFIYFAF